METTLFMADDSVIILRALTEMFSKIPGLKLVGSAETVESAKEAIARLDPDIVILDYQFKQGNGLEIVRFILESQLERNPRIFIFTNYGYPALKRECLAQGADFFFKKIGELELLIKEIKNICHQSSNNGG